MFERSFAIQYLTSKNSFCYLSPKNIKELSNRQIKLNYGNNKLAYLSVEVQSSIKDETVGISSLYAKALGLKANENVTLTEIPKLPCIKSLEVTPLSQNDYDVLELLAEQVQMTLLNQVKVLYTDQKFVIWIGNFVYATVLVDHVKPLSPGYIDNLTEVVLKPPKSKDEKSKLETKFNSLINNCRDNTIFSQFHQFKHDLIAKTVSVTNLEGIHKNILLPFNVFISEKNLNFKTNSLRNNLIYSIKNLVELETEEPLLYVRLYILEDVLKNVNVKIPSNVIFVSQDLTDFFNCRNGAMVLLHPYTAEHPKIERIEIYGKKSLFFSFEEKFKEYLATNCRKQEFILNANFVFNLDDNLKCFVKFEPHKFSFCSVNSDLLRNCKLSLIDEVIPNKSNGKGDQRSLQKFITTVSNYEDIIEQCLSMFTNGQNKLNFDNVLIVGKAGTGKSTLLSVIESKLIQYPNTVYVKRINCKSQKNKIVESLHKYFSNSLLEMIHNQPAVLILDDFHVICDNISENDALAQNALYFNRVGEMLEGLFQLFLKNNFVAIVATAESTSTLNKNVYGTRGNHLFKNVFSIADLSREDRTNVLRYYFSNYDIKDVDYEKLSEETENFITGDLEDFANKALFEAYQENPLTSKLSLTQYHCEVALKSTVVTSLYGINLNLNSTKDFSDVGGLIDVKDTLLETLLWPSKYPNLFSNSPLRLPSGLLLYGPPGTGKTLLAGAAARHCGLRLISIKGPELLSKYIGASEQAVRDVFQKAQSAKPCILFFDEFDSLAPRRGHDNTGVTDRVVNQFLTQLDGVESLSGVFILAATSRPDLLDPALLRPGRLDRHLFCPLPDNESRLQILQSLSKSIKFSANVNLTSIAERCEGFSGADLQSLLYSAQLASVENLLLDEKVNSDDLDVEIEQSRLEEALEKTKPSLSGLEKRKYEKIYDRFRGGAMHEFKVGSRATLA